MRVEMLTVGLFQSNSFIVSCEKTNEAIIIDACDEADRILGYIEREKLDVKMIVNTHSHIDHVTALPKVKSALGVPVVMHEKELELYKGIPQQAAMFGIDAPELVEIDRFVKEGDRISFGTCSGEVVETPGHSPGGITLLFRDESPPRAFVGDVLFEGSIGRTDLPGCDESQMARTLREVIMKLPDDTVVHSGHGRDTTIGREKRTNPFLLQLRN